MPAYIKIGDIDGESMDSDHKGWSGLQSLSQPILRELGEDSFDFKDPSPEADAGLPDAGESLIKFDGIDGEATDVVPVEDLTLNYEKVEHHYDSIDPSLDWAF